ncbi:perlucin-like protein [Mytilus edulis]|uniref:perlucin-like protein n=1 Tax=Mytilus edulis TaxID=6550 RepID=UPI0039F0095B
MKMQGFLLMISMIILSTPLTYCAMSAVNRKTSTFTVKNGENIMSSCNTTDVFSKSESACGARCVLHDACCVASFSKESSICRLDISENCCVATNTAIGWSVMTRNQHIPATCAGCISFGNSMYSIIGDLTEWEKAKVNCKCMGGKLVEMETSEENEFIKNEVRTLNTGVKGYWIGGYNFNNDNDLEWISKPYQVMAFSDMNGSQPDKPLTELCMMIWKSFDFRWGDHSCNSQLSYICEF